MPTGDWAPTPDDVGALLRARTKDRSGNELGTFTEDTRPTEQQVLLLLETATQDLADLISTEDLPERLWRSARRVAAYDTALEVELSYFPEQVASGRSPYAQLKERYDELLRQFKADLAATGEDVPGEADGGTPPDPVFSFPTDPIIGWKAGRW